MLLNTSFLKVKKVPILLLIASAYLYFVFAYQLARTDYTKLLILYTVLFLFFYKLLKDNKNNFRFLAIVAFLFRAVFILAIPNLSQDFYRFIWDGRMIIEGFNPYLYTPESFLINNELPVSQAEELYAGMGTLNGSHFTNYPPLNQISFVIAGVFAGKSILGSALVLRLLLIAADFGTLFYGKKLLEKLQLPIHHIFWYILNPFIIIEHTGNLHFEGMMIFFLVWSLYLLYNNKWKLSAVVFAASVSVKLIPLILLPLFFKWFKKENITSKSQSIDISKLLTFYSIIGLTTILLFLPFYSLEFIKNYAATVGLWFQNFEFNASIYYIAREIGYSFRGYNEIALIGKILPVLVVLFVLFRSLFKRNATLEQLLYSMLLVLSIYLFFSTTVHPWYISTILILSVFTNNKYPLVWSYIIILSYLAYANNSNTENLWIIALEYFIVFSVFLYEIFKRKTIANKLP